MYDLFWWTSGANFVELQINLISQGVSFEHNITEDKGEKGEQ